MSRAETLRTGKHLEIVWVGPSGQQQLEGPSRERIQDQLWTLILCYLTPTGNS